VPEHDLLLDDVIADAAMLPVVDLAVGKQHQRLVPVQSYLKTTVQASNLPRSQLTSEPHKPVATTLTRTCLLEGRFGTSRFSYRNLLTCSRTKLHSVISSSATGQPEQNKKTKSTVTNPSAFHSHLSRPSIERCSGACQAGRGILEG